MSSSVVVRLSVGKGNAPGDAFLILWELSEVDDETFFFKSEISTSNTEAVHLPREIDDRLEEAALAFCLAISASALAIVLKD
jgi:hypothetical protein